MREDSQSTSVAPSYRTLNSHIDLHTQDEDVHPDDVGSEANPVTHDGYANPSKTDLLLKSKFSLGCMMAIVVIAAKTDNTPLSEWTSPIGINALFSILITVSKAAIAPSGSLSALDDASKGPWGALLFLNPSNVKLWPLLATVGAILILVAMAVGPFAQQTVVIRTERVGEQKSGSSIHVSSGFDTGDPSEAELDPSKAFEPPITGNKPQRAFLNGVFDLGSNFQFICPSGNCTWSDFISLAIYSICVDVSDKTQLVDGCTRQVVATAGDQHEPVLSECDEFRNAIFTTPEWLVLPITVEVKAGFAIHMAEVAGNVTLDYTPHSANQTVTEKLLSLAIIQFKDTYV
ncbi:hypothetical protein PG994_004508 [Apiospora phragmitis]|uniref:Uncharacterized protein n=1 Tax=Apiospora phragmitis TaxID=2905665 RepID=A0ABR1VUM7_9PEZI